MRRIIITTTFIALAIASFSQNYLEVTALNNTIAMPIGSTKAITWNSFGVNNIKIEYTANFNMNYNNPNDWQVIEPSVAANMGTYIWNVPNVVFYYGRIRISDVSNDSIYDINDMDFSTYDAVANPKNLKIESPNGGEVLDTASVYFNITCKYQNTASEVQFDYSIDNGANWLAIDTLYSNGLATLNFFPWVRGYNWKMPNINSAQCKVRIRDKVDSTIIDESDGVFTIMANAPKKIEVLSLNNTSAIPIGSAKAITWNSFGADNLKIEYAANFNMNFNNPNDWQIIEPSISANLGYYVWNVPNIVFSYGRIRISDINNDSIYDINDMDFSTYDAIANPKNLKIVSPNGGEVLDTAGVYFNISCKYQNTTSEVQFDYSIDNGANWLTIDTLYSNGLATLNFFPWFRSYNWKIPNISSVQCKVRIRDKVDSTLLDESDGIFTIMANAPKKIEVLSLNNATAIPIGSTKAITWNSFGVDNVKIEYTANFDMSFNSPNDWQIIEPSISANLGYYVWNVPNIVFSYGRIRISDVSNDSIYEINDMDFSTYDAVANPKNLKIVSPNGEDLLKGTSKYFNITVKYQNTTSEVQFAYTIDNGANWQPIDTLFNNGIATMNFFPWIRSYNWKVPNVSSNQCKIRIRDKVDSSIMDESDAPFTIVFDPTVSVEDYSEVSNIDIFPNPTKGQFSLKANSIITKYQVFNSEGICILDQKNSQGISATCDISSFSNGMYYIKIHTNKGILGKCILKIE
jgi:hypothetical protein